MKTIFEFTSYKNFLNDRSSVQRGLRKRLAEVSECQTAYISHVLNGKAHINWDQAEPMAQVLDLSATEKDYFMLLIEYERAGTPALRKYIEKKLQDSREQNLVIKNRIKITESLSDKVKEKYYSRWYYSAIHVMLTIPSLQTKEALIKALRLKSKIVADALEFLVEAKLANKKDGTYLPGPTLLHLAKDSPFIVKHHANWRLRAVQSLEENTNPDDIHYSSVFTLTKSDAERIRSKLIKDIAHTVEIIKVSKEEVTCAMGIDFFEVN